MPLPSADSQFQLLLSDLIEKGESLVTRNSRVKRLFGITCQFDRAPLVTVRKTSWKSALREWEWFMSGSNHLCDLHPSVRSWWKPFARSHGDEDLDAMTGGYVPFNYSWQLRGKGFDQINYLVQSLKAHPFSRRSVISTWDTKEMANPLTTVTNCHGTVIQCFVNPDNSLHLLMYQRSCDVMVGLPHNWIQYWAFLLWLCHAAEKEPGTFTWVGGDVHLYDAHQDLALKVLGARPQESPPLLVYESSGSCTFLADDFSLDREYVPTLHDKAEMIV